MAEPARQHPEQAVEDPFLTALEAAPWSVEPVTDEERAAFQEGWQEYLRGDSVSLEEYVRSRSRRSEVDPDPAP